MRFGVPGKLGRITRAQAEASIKELGGAVGSSVSRKTSYLVAGGDPGSKLEQAKKLGTKLRSADDFLEKIEWAGKP